MEYRLHSIEKLLKTKLIIKKKGGAGETTQPKSEQKPEQKSEAPKDKSPLQISKEKLEQIKAVKEHIKIVKNTLLSIRTKFDSNYSVILNQRYISKAVEAITKKCSEIPDDVTTLLKDQDQTKELPEITSCDKDDNKKSKDLEFSNLENEIKGYNNRLQDKTDLDQWVNKTLEEEIKACKENLENAVKKLLDITKGDETISKVLKDINNLAFGNVDEPLPGEKLSDDKDGSVINKYIISQGLVASLENAMKLIKNEYTSVSGLFKQVVPILDEKKKKIDAASSRKGIDNYKRLSKSDGTYDYYLDPSDKKVYRIKKNSSSFTLDSTGEYYDRSKYGDVLSELFFERMNSRTSGGGNNYSNQLITKYISAIEKKINDDITVKVKSTEDHYKKQSDPMRAALSPGKSIFSSILNNYNDDKEKMGDVMAAEKLSESLEANDLVPRKVLKPTGIDKTIFAFSIIFLRLFTLALIEKLIDKSWIKNIDDALIAFIVIYTVFFGLFVLIINVDTYRLRIVFNYVNFHANGGNVFMHLGMMYLFMFMIYTLLSAIKVPSFGFKKTSISYSEKSSIKYSIQLITMLTWIFLFLIIIIF